MSALKRVGIICVVCMVAYCVGELAQDRSDVRVFGFVATAEAKVGRPLTPVSVAGVGRRTARRCATGVYNC